MRYTGQFAVVLFIIFITLHVATANLDALININRTDFSYQNKLRMLQIRGEAAHWRLCGGVLL